MKLVKLGWLLAATALLVAQDEGALQRAIRKETLEGDLKGAIESYKKLAQGKDRNIAAKALVRIGGCYEKLGDSEARKAYERVVREYGEQKDAVTAANVRLGALARPSTAGPDTHVVASYPVDSQLWPAATSPDGRYLVQTEWPDWLSLRDLRTGQTRPLAKGHAVSARFSPDQSRIAFMRLTDQTPEAWVVGPDGSGLRKLWQGQPGWAAVNSWFPDNKRILIEVTVDQETRRLVVVSAVDGSATKVWEGARPEGYGPLSPDGNWVVFNKRLRRDRVQDELRLLSLTDLRETLLLSDFGPAVKTNWTPDGTGLVFVSDRRKPGEARDLWYLAVANGKAQGRPELLKADVGDGAFLAPITQNGSLYYAQSSPMREVLAVEIDPATGKALGPAVTISGQGAGPAGQGVYSPDGRWLAYGYRKDRSMTEVLRNLDTGEEKMLNTGFTGAEQTWFPDSRSLLLNGRKAGEAVGLYRLDVATGSSTLLKPGVFGAAFVISPDGKTIYYSQRPEKENETRVIAWEIESGKERELLRGDGLGPTHWIGIAISPDGKQVATDKIAGNEHVIEIQPAAGGAKREVYRTRDPQVIHELHWSADGRYLVFGIRNGEQEGLWRIAVAGGSPQQMGIAARTIGKVSLHPDGRHIAYVAAQGGSQVLALENFLPKGRMSK